MDDPSLLQVIQTKLKEGVSIQILSEFLIKKCMYVPVSILQFIKDKEEEKNDG